MSLPRRLTAMLLLAFVGAIAFAGPAAAHTGFESSDPADGAVLDDSVDEILVTFTGEAAPTGDGFQVLEADGTVRQPSEATSTDDVTWVLRFDPPLAAGTTGVRWMVSAPDSHPIDGSFSFASGGDAATAAPGSEALDTFLATSDDAAMASRLAGAARMLSMVGALVGVGALIFAATVLRGHERDIREVMFWVRRAGVVVAVGSLIELAGQISIDAGGDWSALVSPSAVWTALMTSTGLAIALRLGGGVGLVAGAHPVTLTATQVPDAVERVRELVGAGSVAAVGSSPTTPDNSTVDRYGTPEDLAWVPDAASRGALIGAAALVLSFGFDGHTISKGPWLVTALFTVIHVIAAAAWVGGVVMLAVVARRRHRFGEPIRATQLAVRFSVVATGALAAVGVAGVALAVVILDNPGELFSTAWGRLLLVKTAIVAAAAIAGGYNHKLLIPELEAHPDDADLAAHFRRVITAEAGVLVAVGFVTAWLVGAAS